MPHWHAPPVWVKEKLPATFPIPFLQRQIIAECNR